MGALVIVMGVIAIVVGVVTLVALHRLSRQRDQHEDELLAERDQLKAAVDAFQAEQDQRRDLRNS